MTPKDMFEHVKPLAEKGDGVAADIGSHPAWAIELILQLLNDPEINKSTISVIQQI